jgi:hypothetical protein
MISHIVAMKFKSGVGVVQIEALERQLNGLPDIIMEIHSYEFGRDRVHSPRSYDFGLIALFANLESLQRYQAHPAHLEVLAAIQQMCENVVTVDFEYAAPKSAKPIPPTSGSDDPWQAILGDNR